MAETCLHLANVLYLVSFLARDMLWLRALTCLGLVLGIVFFSCQPVPLYGPVVWQSLFLVINLAQIYRLVLERRQLRLTAEQERLCAATFQHRSREELLMLLTRVVHERSRALHDIEQVARRPLNTEERALRDIAFSRLSRYELLNLLTRRVWNAIRHGNPMRWRRRTTGAGTDGRPLDAGAHA